MRAVASDLPAYVGRCASISGVVRGFYLYGDVDGVYRRPRDVLDPSSNGQRLGLDGVHKFDRRHREEYRAAVVTGLVGDCTPARDMVRAGTERG